MGMVLVVPMCAWDYAWLSERLDGEHPADDTVEGPLLAGLEMRRRSIVLSQCLRVLCLALQ